MNDDPASRTEEKMPPELKAKWLEALRGGKYEQAQHVLRNACNGFCCLGVLADVQLPHLWEDRAEESEEADEECFRHDGNETMLSGTVLASFGLTTQIAMRLAELNDGGNSFAVIADYIEANL